ncbi:hypothetical protein [Glutamicibacter ardleyensis]|uniref:hypothetical protein n=1 Tax=Glutamicibacter ardleyensis TaxID=225894 RepID=UPI003FD53343
MKEENIPVPFDYGGQAEKDLVSLFSVLDSCVDHFPIHKKRKEYEWIRVTSSSERWIKIPSHPKDKNLDPKQLGFKMNRSLPFDKWDNDFLESYSKSLFELSEMENSDFFEEAKVSLVSRAIAGQISSALDPNNRSDVRLLVISVLNYLQQATSVTYEGKRLSLNVIYDAERDAENGSSKPLFTLSDYKDLPWSPALGTTQNTAISVCTGAGEVCVSALQDLQKIEPEIHLNSESLMTEQENLDEIPVPSSLELLAEWTKPGRRVGFSLFESGDIAVVIGGVARYVYRQGSWRTFQLEHVLSIAWGRTKLTPKIKISLLETVLDASFHRHGGSLAIVASGHRARFNVEIKKQIFGSAVAGDRLTGSDHNIRIHHPYWQYAGGESIESNIVDQIFSESQFDKRRALFENGNLSLNFQDLSRNQRLELLNMDGITILDHEGRILGIGVIYPLESTDQTGGRESVARELGQFGSAFKVSQDGPISLYGCTSMQKLADHPNAMHSAKLITKFG